MTGKRSRGGKSGDESICEGLAEHRKGSPISITRGSSFEGHPALLENIATEARI